MDAFETMARLATLRIIPSVRGSLHASRVLTFSQSRVGPNEAEAPSPLQTMPSRFILYESTAYRFRFGFDRNTELRR